LTNKQKSHFNSVFIDASYTEEATFPLATIASLLDLLTASVAAFIVANGVEEKQKYPTAAAAAKMQ